MPRVPRLQYENAIYHIVTRGDGRRKLFHGEDHYKRFTKGLAEEVDRSGWQVVACCWMPNQIHALIKTPRPNLCNGMQHWLSGYDAEEFERQIRRSSVITVDDVIENTAKEYGVSPAEYSGFRSSAGGRDVAAYLCRRFTSATLAELSERFGLGHPDSSSDMVKRATKLIKSNREVRKRAKRIEKSLRSKPETRV